MKMKSVMQHNFSQVPRADIPRSSFNRSHGYKTTFNADELIPVFVDECLPGDTMSLSMSAFTRLATPLVPVMDNLYLDVFFFAVPNRLLWSNWKKFNGEQANPADSTSYLLPTTPPTAATGWLENSMADYFGLPIKHAPTAWNSVSALPFRAYNQIWNAWFRDQNLQNSVTENIGDGPDASTDYVLKKRGKRHDYFTSALPLPQKHAAIPMPMATSAPLELFGTTLATKARNVAGALFGAVANTGFTIDAAGDLNINGGGGATDSIYDVTPHTRVNLATGIAGTINELRQAVQLQKLYERDARGGTRYTEIVRAHFGVTSPDARQQRPEYLGGGSFSIVYNPIPQTSATGLTGGATAQGSLTAYATGASANAAGFTYSATEHCTLIGLICARADLNYQSGIDRMWSRSTRFDFYWPALSHIGEQSILNKEIFLSDSATDIATFGFQERYAEYRYKNSRVTGLFNQAATGNIDEYHFAQVFSALPTLGDTFIQQSTPMSRTSAVSSGPSFLLDAYFNYKCARPMPVYSVPGLMDHF